MIESLTPNTQAILLLTAPLVAGRSQNADHLLSHGEYNQLARLLRENRKQPADLIGAHAHEVIELCSPSLGRSRLEELLGRGFLLAQAVDRWNTRTIWVISRADTRYPKRWKGRLREDAPPLLYGCGDSGLLEKGGLAVVGSHHADEERIRYTEMVGRLSADAGRAIVSSGTPGIGHAAIHGCLGAGGEATGILSDSLETAALARENRNALKAGRLVLASPCDPSTGFEAGHAMPRNTLMYALADAALVITSDLEKGDTWAGATEQLDHLQFVPVFVANGTRAGKGNVALLRRGGRPWPDPQSGPELDEAIAAALNTPHEVRQDSFPLTLREEA